MNDISEGKLSRINKQRSIGYILSYAQYKGHSDITVGELAKVMNITSMEAANYMKTRRDVMNTGNGTWKINRKVIKG